MLRPINPMARKRIAEFALACAVISGAAAFHYSSRHAPPAGGGRLHRPLRVGIVSWPGYAGGLTANSGFHANPRSIFTKRYGVLVEFVLMEDVETRAKAFSRGGDGDVDVIWSTVDFWAYELPGFRKGGVRARAIMQVDWSQGGDAIVAAQSVRRIEDLKDKRISLALFTPSHWLLESSLRSSSLTDSDQLRIAKGLIGKNASPDARSDFVAGKVDAAVVWEPDVTEALRQRPDAHILSSTATARNLIADVMVVRDDFIALYPETIRAFVRGWLDGAVTANQDPETAAHLLMQNEPVYRDLGVQATRDGLTKVRLADIDDNTRMFGLDGSTPIFDTIFRQAAETWTKRGYLEAAVSPDVAKNDRFLREVHPPGRGK